MNRRRTTLAIVSSILHLSVLVGCASGQDRESVDRLLASRDKGGWNLSWLAASEIGRLRRGKPEDEAAICDRKLHAAVLFDDAGQTEIALRLLDDAARAAEASGDSWRRLTVMSEAARIAVREGLTEHARAKSRALFELAVSVKATDFESEASARLAELDGHLPRAAADYAEAVTLFAAAGDVRKSERLKSEQARALQKSGDAATAAVLLEELLQAARAAGLWRWIAEIEIQKLSLAPSNDDVGYIWPPYWMVIDDGFRFGLHGQTLAAMFEMVMDEGAAPTISLADVQAYARSLGRHAVAARAGVRFAAQLVAERREREALGVAASAMASADACGDRSTFDHATALHAVASLAIDGDAAIPAARDLILRLRSEGATADTAMLRERLVRLLLEARRFKDVRDEMAAWRSDARADGDLLAAARISLMESELLRLEGRRQGALAILTEIMERRPPPGFPTIHLTAKRLIGWLALDEGRWDDAKKALLEVEWAATKQGDADNVSWARVGVLRAARMMEDPRSFDDSPYFIAEFVQPGSTGFDRIGEDLIRACADESLLTATTWRRRYGTWNDIVSDGAFHALSTWRREVAMRGGYGRGYGRWLPVDGPHSVTLAALGLLDSFVSREDKIAPPGRSPIMTQINAFLLFWCTDRLQNRFIDRPSTAMMTARSDAFGRPHSAISRDPRLDALLKRVQQKRIQHKTWPCIVAYHVIEERLVVAVAGEEKERIVDLGSWPEIRSIVEAWLAALDGDDPDEYSRAIAAFEWLIRPIVEFLPDGSEVKVVPVDLLERVPFDALAFVREGTSHRLVERHTMTMSPTIGLVIEREESRWRPTPEESAAAKRGRRDLSDSPETRSPGDDSGRSIVRDILEKRGCAGVEVLAAPVSRTDARKGGWKKSLDPLAHMWHFDGPGIIDRRSPDGSGVLIGKDERLTIRDIGLEERFCSFVTLGGPWATTTDGVAVPMEDVAREWLSSTCTSVLVAPPARDRIARAEFLADLYERLLRDRDAAWERRDIYAWGSRISEYLRKTKLEWLAKNGPRANPGVWARCVLWQRR